MRGSCIKTTHLGRDVAAGLRKLFCARVTEYAGLLKRARDEVMKEMVSEAEQLGTNSVIGVCLSTASGTVERLK